MERPAPPITVSVPGRGEVPSELLAVGPPAPRRAPLPLRERVTALSASVVLLAGVGSAASYEPPPPAPPPPPPTVRGVTASADPLPGAQQERFVARFGLRVELAALTGRGDSGGPSVEDDATVVALTGRGFDVTVAGRAVGQQLRQGRGASTTTFDVEARVVDCSVDTQAPRRLLLQVRRGDGVVVALPVVTDAGVVRGLDRLVSRSCRRPRG